MTTDKFRPSDPAAVPSGRPASEAVGGGLGTTLLEPPPRDDDLCVVCLRPRLTYRSARYAPGQADADAFCDTACCRTWFGCELAATVTGPKKAAA